MESNNTISKEVDKLMRDVIYWRMEVNAKQATIKELCVVLEAVSKILDIAINGTPTGGIRNALCDANILSKQALQKLSNKVK